MISIIERCMKLAIRLVVLVFLMVPVSAIASSCDAPTGLELPDKEEEEEEEEGGDEEDA